MLSRSGKPAPTTLFIEVRPQGMDLLSGADQRWLTSKVDAVRPDIIMGGPLYKLFVAGPEDEHAARALAGYLDRLRRRYDCAIALEAHSPHGFANDRAGLRPFGSSLWMRWPEFGFGLAPIKKDKTKMEFVAWRGLRDTRDWPSALEYDRAEPGHWLWCPRKAT
jgi:replicative DNA helicase